MDIFSFSGGHTGRRTRLCAFAAALLCATWASAAAAQGKPLSVTVKYRDLDLKSPAGAQRLLRRIKFAAEHVCGEAMIVDLAQRDDLRRCRDEAVERAVRDADIPTLSAINLPMAAVVLTARR
jgi:UrcA family protein